MAARSRPLSGVRHASTPFDVKQPSSAGFAPQDAANQAGNIVGIYRVQYVRNDDVTVVCEGLTDSPCGHLHVSTEFNIRSRSTIKLR